MLLLAISLCILLLPASQVLSAPHQEPDPPNGTCLYDGLTMGDPADPTAYFVCCAHYWLIKYCPDGQVFDKYNLTCINSHPTPFPTAHHFHSPSIEETIFIPTTTAPPTTSQFCVPDSRIPNEIDNTAYDVCVDGTHYETRYCPAGSVYNRNTQQCQPLPTTKRPLPPKCREGATQPNKYGSPNTYLLCYHGQWIIRYCNAGTVYQPNLHQCVFPFTTRRPTTRKPTTKKPKPQRPTTPTKRPFIDGSCQESADSNGYRPNPDDCRTYFQCVHSEWMLRDCGPGTRWVQDILGCDYYNGHC